MAISICLECRGKISTDINTCPHCGAKIKESMFNEDNVCKINGIEYDLTPFMVDIINEAGDFDIDRRMTDELKELTQCASIGSLTGDIYFAHGVVPKIFDGPTMKEMEEDAERYRATCPKCPTCGSTNIRNIGFGERTLSVNLLGFASKKFNKTFECNHCGYTW